MDDERVARLYGLPPEEFTAERNALATELRAAGDGAAARQVKALRKPTAAAWAVNQLVRAEPDLVEAILGAGGELRQAHRQAASRRGADQLRAAADAERAAVEALVARSAAVLGRQPSSALAEAIRNTLHAASSDDEARERVASGTVVHELRPVGLGPVPAGRGAKREPPPAAQDDRRQAARAQRDVAAAERALERAEAAYTHAREAADDAAERVKAARKRLRDAQAATRRRR